MVDSAIVGSVAASLTVGVGRLSEAISWRAGIITLGLRGSWRNLGDDELDDWVFFMGNDCRRVEAISKLAIVPLLPRLTRIWRQ